MNDRYRLRQRLGAGGMSEVWRAHDEVLGRDVAVKVLAPGAASDAARPARIRLEARAAAGLRHPHIIEVYDYGEATDEAGRARPYVVMELLEGPSLDDLLTGRSLPWAAATRIGAQVAAALAAAHARGVVHRDVKPGNVMVTADGVKLVDFGIAAAAGAVDESDGEVLGTPAYLAPERLDGGPVRVATDVYALGLLLYRALAGHLPWNGSTVTQMVGNHLYVEPAPLPRITGLPHRVADLVRRCLAKRPEDRPTAAEAARILGAAVGLPAPEPITLPSVTAQASAATVAIRIRRPRRPALLTVAAVMLVALVASFASLASWPGAGSRPVQAEAGTVPSSAAATPKPSASSPAARTDRPVTRRTTAAEPAAAKPRPATQRRTEPIAAPRNAPEAAPQAAPKDAPKVKKAPKVKAPPKAKSKGKAPGKS